MAVLLCAAVAMLGLLSVLCAVGAWTLAQESSSSSYDFMVASGCQWRDSGGVAPTTAVLPAAHRGNAVSRALVPEVSLSPSPHSGSVLAHITPCRCGA